MIARVFTVNSWQTALRCWMPVNQVVKVSAVARFSLRQQCVDYYRPVVAKLGPALVAEGSEEIFEPTIATDQDGVETAGPVTTL